jgi:hypothetical protein
MFTAYHEIQSATTVEASVWARLLPEGAPLLCVLRRTSVDVFSVGASQPQSRAQLRSVASFPLHEPACDMVAVPLSPRASAVAYGCVPPPAGVQALLLTLRDARMALVALDPFSLRLRSLALLNLEEGGTGPGCSSTVARRLRMVPCSRMAQRGAARVDPSGRAAAWQPFDDQLVVVPLVGGGDSAGGGGLSAGEAAAGWAVEGAVSGVGGGGGGGGGGGVAPAASEAEASAALAAAQESLTRAVVGRPYVLDLATLGTGPDGRGYGGGNGVTDLAFLSGGGAAGAPLAALLLHPRVSSASRASALQLTGCLLGVSLSLTGGAPLVLWERDGLPTDAHTLVALPPPACGVLVASPSALLHFDSARSYRGLALNAYAAYTVDARAKHRLDTNGTHGLAPAHALSPHVLEAGSRFTVLGATEVLAVDAGGVPLLISVHLSGGGQVVGLTAARAAVRVPPAACLAWLPAAGGGALAAAAAAAARADAPSTWTTWGLLFLGSRVADSALALVGVGTGGFCEGAEEVEEGGGCEGGGGAGAEGAPAEGAPAPAAAPEVEEAGPSLAELAGLAGLCDDEEEDEGAAGGEGGGGSGGGKRKAAALDEEDAFLYGGGGGGAGGRGVVGAPGALSAPPSAARTLLLLGVDALPSLAPVGAVAMGRSARRVGEEDEEPPLSPPPAELVLAVGRGDGAAVAVLHRALRPLVVTASRLAGCVAMWALDAGRGAPPVLLISSAAGGGGGGEGGAAQYHRALRWHGEEGLQRMGAGDSGLCAPPLGGGGGALVAAGVVDAGGGGAPLFALIFPAALTLCSTEDGHEVLLALGAAELCGGGEGRGGRVVAGAAVSGPHVLLRLSDGRVRVGTVGEEGAPPAGAGGGEFHALLAPPGSGAGAGLYLRDVDDSTPPPAPPPPQHPQPPHAAAATAAALFHDAGGALGAAICAPPGGHYAAVARRSGALEIFALPAWTLVWRSEALAAGAWMLLPLPLPLPAGGGADANAAPPLLPPTFVRDVALFEHPGASAPASVLPTLALLAVTSRDDTYSYTLSARAAGGGGGVGDAGAAASSSSTTAAAPASPPPAKRSKRWGDAAAAAVVPHLPSSLPPPPAPLLLARAAATARWVRDGTCGAPTRVAAPSPGMLPKPYPSPPPEALWAAPAPPRLVPFSNAGGWAGVAVLTPAPQLRLSVRGTLAPLPLQPPGEGGGVVPGDALFARGGAVVAVTPLHVPGALPAGLVVATPSAVHFCTLPPPAWAAPRAGGAGLLPPLHPRTLRAEAGGAVPVAAGEWVRACVTGAPPPGVPLRSSARGAPAGTPSHREALLAAAAVAHVPPPSGGAPPAAFFKHAVTAALEGATPGLSAFPGAGTLPFSAASVRRIVYLEVASAREGAAELGAWWRARKEAARVGGGAPPPAVTAAQAAACVAPLYAAVLAVPSPRDAAGDAALEKELLEANGGEHGRIDTGPVRDFSHLPLPPTPPGAPPDGAWDALVGAFHAGGIADHPPALVVEHYVALLRGSGDREGPWQVDRGGDNFRLERGERVCSMAEVLLSGDEEGGGGGNTPALVVGTGFSTVRGEDTHSRGRVLVFRLARVVVAGAAAPALQLKLSGATEVKGPVSFVGALTAAGRYRLDFPPPAPGEPRRAPLPPPPPGTLQHRVLVSTGRRIEVHEWYHGALRLLGYWEAGAWAGAVACVRDFIAVGDAARGPALLRWREDDRQFIPLACEAATPAGCALTSLALLVAGERLGIVGVDTEGNTTVWEYAPDKWGVSLRVVADGRCGGGPPVAPAAAARARLPRPPGPAPDAGRKRHGTLLAGADGSVGALLPLAEADFKRLFALSTALSTALPHAAGANPRAGTAFASVHAPLRHRAPDKQPILSGPLLARFAAALSGPAQDALAEAAGSSQDRVLETLREVDVAATLF